MQGFEDFYEILGVNPRATTEEVKRAYLDKSYILHPDRTVGAPESARKKAEAELKRVNVAWDTLKDSRLRSDYDAKWRSVRQKPRPVVEPQLLKFGNVQPHDVQKGSFVIRNLGGPYSKINISNPDSSVRVVKWTSLAGSDELPLRVELEAVADEWGKSYLETVYIRLDDEEARVTVQLQAAPQPAPKANTYSSGRVMSTPPIIKRAVAKSLYSWMKLLIGILILVSIIGTIFVGLVAFTHRLPPIVGAASFISVVVLFIVLTKITRSEKYRWRKPGFGLVVLCTIGLLLVFAFSGVQPFAAYKDSAFNAVRASYESLVKP